MDGSLWVRLSLLLWPLRCFVLTRRSILLLALFLYLAPWLPPPRPPAAFSVHSLLLPVGPPMVGVAVDGVLGRAFLAGAGGDVWAIDVRTEQILGPSNAVARGTATLSGAMAVDLASHRLYVVNLAGDLAALDGRSGRPDPPWNLKPTPGLALDSVADRLLVSQAGKHALLALDAGTGQVVAAVALAEPAGLVAVDARARRIYVAAASAARLGLLDADNFRPVATVPLPDPIDALAVDSTAHRIYAAAAASGVIITIDGRSGAVLSTLQVGHAPVALAVNPASGHLFVADADSVAVVDTRRNTVVATIPIVGAPTAMAVDARTGLVYVASGAAGTAAALPSSPRVTVLRDQRRPSTVLATIVAAILQQPGRRGRNGG